MERLQISSGDGDSIRTEVPIKSLLSILNNNKSLEEVVLKSILVIKDTNPAFKPEVSLPNLQSLSLSWVYALANGLFDNLSASQLKRLEIRFLLPKLDEKKGDVAEQEEEDKKEVKDAFEHFALLLKSCCSSLKSLSIKETSSSPDQQVSQIESSTLPLSLAQSRTINLSSSSARLDELLACFSFPRIEVIASHSTYSDPSSTQLIHQILADSSATLEGIILGCFDPLTYSRSIAPIVIKSKNSNPKKLTIPSFSRVRTLELGRNVPSSLEIFSKASFGGLEKMSLILSYEDEETKRIQMQSLLSLLRSNASSLSSLKISRSITTFGNKDPSSRFAKSPYDLEMLEEVKKNPIKFSNLKILSITGCHPLLDLFQLCELPILSEFGFDDFGLRAPPKAMTREEFMAYDEEVEFKKKMQRRKDIERQRAMAREETSVLEKDYDSDDTEVMIERDEAERAESRANDWI